MDSIMPIFEYRCGKCGQVSDFLEKSAADSRHACPRCGGRKMEKLFSTFSARSSSASQPPSCSACASGPCPLP
jgi:putative FmdB family regulatory protein